MMATGGPCELEPVIAPEFDLCEDSGFDDSAASPGTVEVKGDAAEFSPSYGEGAWSLLADAGRKYEEEDDSDYDFDDFDYDDDSDKDEEVDEDFEDDDEDLDDDLDDFDATDDA